MSDAKACSLITAYGQNTFSESVSGVWGQGCVNVCACACVLACTQSVSLQGSPRSSKSSQPIAPSHLVFAILMNLTPAPVTLLPPPPTPPLPPPCVLYQRTKKRRCQHTKIR